MWKKYFISLETFRKIKQFYAIALHEFNITHSQAMILCTLIAHPQRMLTKQNLRESTKTSAATLNADIKKLTEEGWVEQAEITEKKHDLFIIPTNKTSKNILKIQTCLNQCSDQLFRGVSEDEMEWFQKVLERLERNLKYYL